MLKFECPICKDAIAVSNSHRCADYINNPQYMSIQADTENKSIIDTIKELRKIRQTELEKVYKEQRMMALNMFKSNDYIYISNSKLSSDILLIDSKKFIEEVLTFGFRVDELAKNISPSHSVVYYKISIPDDFEEL